MKKIINNTENKRSTSNGRVLKESVTSSTRSNQYKKNNKTGERVIARRPISRTSDNTKVK